MYAGTTSAESAEQKGKKMKNTTPKKALALLDKTAANYASVFNNESVTQFKIKLARVALAKTPSQSAEALDALLAEIANHMTAEIVETKNTYTTKNNAKALVLDKVLPTAFGEKYHAKMAQDSDCIACGRSTSEKNAQGVIVVDGGYGICTPINAQLEGNDGGFMGWFPVGSECIKNVPVEYRAENPYTM